MSHAAMAWAWTVRAGSPTAKTVLLAIADHADGEGRCYPSIGRIAERTELSDRAIRQQIDSLVASGLVLKAKRAGSSLVLTLRFEAHSADEPRHDVPDYTPPTPAPRAAPPPSNPGTTCRTPTGEPRHDVPDSPPDPGTTCRTPTGEPRHDVPDSPPDPGTTCRTPRHDVPTEPVIESSKEERDVPPSVRHATEDDAKPRRERMARGGRIDASWQPSIADRDFARGLGIDPDRLVGEFVDYWIAVPGKTGIKSDWSATWRNRCRQVADRRGGGLASPSRPGGGMSNADAGRIESMRIDGRFNFQDDDLGPIIEGAVA